MHESFSALLPSEKNAGCFFFCFFFEFVRCCDLGSDLSSSPCYLLRVLEARLDEPGHPAAVAPPSSSIRFLANIVEDNLGDEDRHASRARRCSGRPWIIRGFGSRRIVQARHPKRRRVKREATSTIILRFVWDFINLALLRNAGLKINLVVWALVLFIPAGVQTSDVEGPQVRSHTPAFGAC